MDDGEVRDELSLRRILFGQANDEGVRASLNEKGGGNVDPRIASVPPTLRGPAREEVFTVVARVLDLPVIDVLAAGWRKWDAIEKAATQTLETPGETELVELVDHTITSLHHPRIDVVLDGQQIAEVRVEISVTIDLHAVTAIVTGGRLSALRSGRADVRVTLSVEEVQVAEATRRVELPIEVGLGDGIQIAYPADAGLTARG